jgi:hypothetical protein
MWDHLQVQELYHQAAQLHPPHGTGTSHAGERGSSLGCAFASMLYGTAFAGSGAVSAGSRAQPLHGRAMSHAGAAALKIIILYSML